MLPLSNETLSLHLRLAAADAALAYANALAAQRLAFNAYSKARASRDPMPELLGLRDAHIDAQGQAANAHDALRSAARLLADMGTR
jgi:hypothetical protein